MVRAMPIIAAELPEARLAVIGFGPDEERIRSIIISEGMTGRVRLVGRVSGREIPAHLASADLLVLPSIRIEGLGVVLLEALASGTPVVGTDVGGIPDIINDGYSGLLCPSQNPPALAAACIRMFQDEDLRLRTIRNGRQLVEDRFSWERIGALLERILLDCVGPARAPVAGGDGAGAGSE